jgi:PAS domain S-box-containing protein
MTFAEIIDGSGFLPHKDSFGPHTVVLGWYEVAVWFATIAWIVNFIVVLKLSSEMPNTVRSWIKPLVQVTMCYVGLSVLRAALNGVVLHWPVYEIQAIIFFLDAHLVIGLATLGIWYLLRKDDSIFVRMARHKRNSDRFQAMAESTRLTGMIEFDQGSNIWFVNPAAARIFGYGYGDDNVSELVGEKFTILMPEETKTDHLDCVNQFLDTGEWPWMKGDRPDEKVGVRKNGERFDMEITMSGYNLGGSWRFLAIIRDITYRRNLEKAANGYH